MNTYYHGYEGSVRFNATGGSTSQVTTVTSWAITITKQILNTTTIEDTFERRAGGLVSGSGSIELIYNGENTDLIESINSSSDNGDALFELYLSEESGKRILFNGILESASYGSSIDGIQKINCNFVTNGTIQLEL